MDACLTLERRLTAAELDGSGATRSDEPAVAKPAVVARPASAPAPGGFRLTYVPALDGLRGLACLLVICFHLYPETLSGGYFGVDIFLVLSGFLITSLLLHEWDDTGHIDLKCFFARRVLRLMPAFVTMLVTCWVVACCRVPAAEMVMYTKALFLNLIGQSNRIDLMGDCFVAPYAHTWSLAIEDQFYVLWPVIACTVLTQNISRRWMVFLMVLGITGCAGARIWIAFNGRGGPEMSVGLQNRADALLLGCLISMLAVWNMLPRGRWFRIALRAAAVCMWGLLIFTCRYATPQAPYLFRGVLTLFAIGTAICVLDLVVGRPKIIGWLLENRALRGIGRLSYGLYLWHWPVLIVVYSFLPPKTDPKFFTKFCIVRAIALVCFLAAALVSYYVIERPFLRLRPARKTRSGPAPAAVDAAFATTAPPGAGELVGAV